MEENQESKNEKVEVNRDLVAAILSIVPGAGHLYKRHILLGSCLLLLGVPVCALISALLILGTFGISLIAVPIAYWAGVAYSAFKIEDWHGHHHFRHRS